MATLSVKRNNLATSRQSSERSIREASVLRDRDNRSPSRMYEDSIIIERKIRELGLFSENVGWTFSTMLEDGQDTKNIVKIGFKEIEREMQELDQNIQEEKKERQKEIAELRGLLESKVDGLEDSITRLEKLVDSRLLDLDQACKARGDKTADNLEMIVNKIMDNKISEIDAKCNQIEEKIMDNAIGTDRKLKAFESKQAELMQSVVQDMETKNKVVLDDLQERNKMALDTIQIQHQEKGNELDELKTRLLKDQEEERQKATEMAKAMKTCLAENTKKLDDLRSESGAEIKKLAADLDSLEKNGEANKSELDSMICKLKETFINDLDSRQTDIENTFAKQLKEVKDIGDKNHGELRVTIDQADSQRTELEKGLRENDEHLQMKIAELKSDLERDREKTDCELDKLSDKTTKTAREMDERLSGLINKGLEEVLRGQDNTRESLEKVEKQMVDKIEEMKLDTQKIIDEQKEEMAVQVDKTLMDLKLAEECLEGQKKEITSQSSRLLQLEQNLDEQSRIANILREKEDDLEEKVGLIQSDLSLPLSVVFNAIREVDYVGGGEEFLTFTSCTINQGQAMDSKSGVFTVPVTGVYLISLSVCSKDRKKVFAAIKVNSKEVGSLYDQNHVDNNKSSMCTQVMMLNGEKGDRVQVYMYTGTGTTDKAGNHFTQFSGVLLSVAKSQSTTTDNNGLQAAMGS